LRSNHPTSLEGTADSRSEESPLRTRRVQTSLRDECNTKLACPSVKTLVITHIFRGHG
jgi:hypothetical protein